MITIQQRPSSKVAGLTSLFCTFDYDVNIIDIIRRIADGTGIYNKTMHTWELPLNTLSSLIDNLAEVTDIELKLIPDKKPIDTELNINPRFTPFEHQIEATRFMCQHPNSLLLEPPGLGKTNMTILTAEHLYNEGLAEHCLVICGINTLKQNWKREISKFSNLDCVVIGAKVSKKGKITYKSLKDRAEQLYNPIKEFFVIINVESIREELIQKAIIESKNNFDMIVVDEIHKCAGQSEQSKGLLKIAKKVGKYHYGLTGTLLTNSPLNAYVPLKFINQYNCNLTEFKNNYCNIDIVFGHYQISGYKHLDQLQSDISQVSLRHDKALLKLPAKTIIPEVIEMSSQHESFYTQLAQGAVEEADRVEIKNTSLLGLVVRLRQASTCPELLTSKEFVNSKLDRAEDLIKEIVDTGEKVVVFSTFKQPLNTLQERLKDFKPLLCTGDVDDSVINDSINSFQTDPSKQIMLATISKMSTGVTLTSASYMILLDQPWVPSDRDQAIDRIYRIGTSKPITVYCLINKGTIDERVQQLLESKQALSDYVIDNKLSEKEELNYLIGVSTPKFIGEM